MPTKNTTPHIYIVIQGFIKKILLKIIKNVSSSTTHKKLCLSVSPSEILAYFFLAIVYELKLIKKNMNANIIKTHFLKKIMISEVIEGYIFKVTFLFKDSLYLRLFLIEIWSYQNSVWLSN